MNLCLVKSVSQGDCDKSNKVPLSQAHPTSGIETAVPSPTNGVTTAKPTLAGTSSPKQNFQDMVKDIKPLNTDGLKPCSMQYCDKICENDEIGIPEGGFDDAHSPHFCVSLQEGAKQMIKWLFDSKTTARHEFEKRNMKICNINNPDEWETKCSFLIRSKLGTREEWEKRNPNGDYSLAIKSLNPCTTFWDGRSYCQTNTRTNKKLARGVDMLENTMPGVKEFLLS
tara:strand:- start:1027 stop:1704 length:678 start_codon:yes stop_codon:yes gene_type:complete